ncbi:MAG TPA: ROK family protein [Acidimicrobiales bacterium]|nr:ROK family protein [Acidimicrobiales bacterium]
MALAVGVDLGGTKCLGVALDEAGAVVAEHRLPTPTGGPAILDTLAAVAAAVAAGGEVATLGVGAPGLVDGDGVLHAGANLPGVTMLAVATELGARIPGAAVRVENDASCAAWGEYVLGAARGSHTAVVVTQGTGIGGGILSGGRLFRGAHGFGGEIGHMVVCPDGPPCPCGKRGCWERYAAGSALGHRGREAAAAGRGAAILELAGGDAAAVRGEHVTAAAAAGDAEAMELVAQFAWWVALGLGNLTELVDPDVIVLGGGLVEAGDTVLGPTRAAFRELVQGWAHRPEVRLVPAELGERAGAIGAADLARQPADVGPGA